MIGTVPQASFYCSVVVVVVVVSLRIETRRISRSAASPGFQFRSQRKVKNREALSATLIRFAFEYAGVRHFCFLRALLKSRDYDHHTHNGSASEIVTARRAK